MDVVCCGSWNYDGSLGWSVDRATGAQWAHSDMTYTLSTLLYACMFVIYVYLLYLMYVL